MKVKADWQCQRIQLLSKPCIVHQMRVPSGRSTPYREDSELCRHWFFVTPEGFYTRNQLIEHTPSTHPEAFVALDLQALLPE